MQLMVRTADRVHQGKLTIDDGQDVRTTVGEIIEVVRESFTLSSAVDYFIRSERIGKQLDPRQTLVEADVKDEDVLEVAPILQAGGR